jgi:hypothetical protein
LQNGQSTFLRAILCLHALLDNIADSVGELGLAQHRSVLATVTSQQVGHVEAFGRFGEVGDGAIEGGSDDAIRMQVVEKRGAHLQLLYDVFTTKPSFSARPSVKQLVRLQLIPVHCCPHESVALTDKSGHHDALPCQH